MMSLVVVSKDEAKGLGMEVRARPAGPCAVRVELEFDAKGPLQTFSRVDLESGGGGQPSISTPMQQEPSVPGRVAVGFAADRDQLGAFTLRVVMCSPQRNLVGYDLRIKDFVDVATVG